MFDWGHVLLDMIDRGEWCKLVSMRVYPDSSLQDGQKLWTSAERSENPNNVADRTHFYHHTGG